MPQCGTLRSISVCGLEPTDPPPQKIEEEMKGAPYRPRPEGRNLRFSGSAARLIETFGTSFLPRSFWLAAGQIGIQEERSRWRPRMRFRDDTGRGPEAGRHLQLSVKNEAVVPVGKIGGVEETASPLFPAG